MNVLEIIIYIMKIMCTKSCLDICWRFWLASFLLSLWLVWFEGQTWLMAPEKRERACDSVKRDLRAWTTEVFVAYAVHEVF